MNCEKAIEIAKKYAKGDDIYNLAEEIIRAYFNGKKDGTTEAFKSIKNTLGV